MTKKAFIVGNGSSLRYTPLHLLEGKETFAVNQIHLIFPRTTWRPKYYVKTDDAFENEDHENWEAEIFAAKEAGCTIFLGPWYRNQLGDRINCTETSPHCREQRWHVGMPGANSIPDKWHPMEYCQFGGSLAVAIQIAARHPWAVSAIPNVYDEIYLVGCDCDYKDNGINHFTHEYRIDVDMPIPPSVMKADKIRAHEIANRSSKVPIYNATIGGELEVYPRVNFFQAVKDA